MDANIRRWNKYFSSYRQNFVNIGERMGDKSGLNQPLVNSVLLDNEKDEIWVGTDGGGLNHVDRTGNMVQYYPVRDMVNHKQSNIIKSLMWDRKNGYGLVLWKELPFLNRRLGAPVIWN